GWFAIAYTRYFVSPGLGDYDVHVARYDTIATLLSDQVIDGTTRTDIAPSIAMDDAHNIVVGWQAYVGSDWDIYAERIDQNGLLGGRLTIASTLTQERGPAVALNRTTGAFGIAYVDGNLVRVKEYDGQDVLIKDLTWDTWTSEPALSVGGDG